MAKELSENKETPNINFLEFQQELFGVADDIKSSLKKTGLKKLFGGNKDNPQVDGNVIGEHAPESKEVAKFERKRNHLEWVARRRLAQNDQSKDRTVTLPKLKTKSTPRSKPKRRASGGEGDALDGLVAEDADGAARGEGEEAAAGEEAEAEGPAAEGEEEPPAVE